jgi:hypothetical protein
LLNSYVYQVKAYVAGGECAQDFRPAPFPVPGGKLVPAGHDIIVTFCIPRRWRAGQLAKAIHVLQVREA